MNTQKDSVRAAVIIKRTDGYYVELDNFGKFFSIGESKDWAKCFIMAEAFAAYLEVFTDPKKSLSEFQATFLGLKKIVDAVQYEFPFEGIEGFSAGDYTYFARFEDSVIGVQFGNLNVYLTKSGEYVVELITSFHPKKTTIVCSGVTEETVIQILKNSQGSRSYQEPYIKQLHFTERNLQYFNSVRLTD